MRPEHLYYKEVNAKDGAYYRRWASVFGLNMSEVIDRLYKLKLSHMAEEFLMPFCISDVDSDLLERYNSNNY